MNILYKTNSKKQQLFLKFVLVSSIQPLPKGRGFLSHQVKEIELELGGIEDFEDYEYTEFTISWD
jgi:hypothetical protein